MIRRESIEEAFTELINVGIKEESLEIAPTAKAYVIKVVAGFADKPQVLTKSIYVTDLLREGLGSDGLARREYLRVAGDIMLFVSGLFPDSLNSPRSFFNLADYIDMGQTAYHHIDSALFDELCIKFPEVVNVLNHVSLSINLTSQDLVKYVIRRKTIDACLTRR